MKKCLPSFTGRIVVLLSVALAATGEASSRRSWVKVEKYSGAATADPINQADFRQLAYELQAEHPGAYDRLRGPRNNQGNRHALSVIHWIRSVETDQLEGSYVQYSSGTTNITLFAFAPVKPTTYRGGELKLGIPSDMLFEEVADPKRRIVHMRIDGGDGRGWQKIAPNHEATVTYSSIGTKTLLMEATLADGSILSAATTLEVAALATPDPTQTIQVSADAPYSLYSGSVYVLKSDTHSGLRNPVLAVEGFDMNNDMDWDVLYNILNKEALAETLQSYGRDLVVLDFGNATADIFGNAEVAMAAIRYINANRNDPGDKFTVIGASMGGLVTRNALARFDGDPTLHNYGQSDVDTWISFDSPQEGANIPLGIQEFFSFFGAFAGDYPDLATAQDYKDKIDAPAAKQMLLCHYTAPSTGAGNPYHDAFKSAMDAQGYPTSCKKIAISNGSGYGALQPFLPGEQVIEWYHASIPLDITGRIYALYKSDSAQATVFYGHFNPFNWFWEHDVNETTYKYNRYAYALDNASGGTRDSFLEVFNSLPSGYKDAGDWCKYPDHCFIPATSSLGLPLSWVEQTIDGNATMLALSPFDEIHYAITNEEHIDINARNKRWFMRAILENQDSDADGFDDYTEYLAGTAYDSPSSNPSLSTTIAIPQPATEAVLVWNAYPNTNYKIYFTESLSDEWQLIDTIAPTSATQISNSYPNVGYSTNGFFKITSQPVDPVTD
ncbi:MAG: GPI inositol-deacylase [Kiritimatiellales bacterium]|nr:GPI inositol-deacylase [Kiritimatiellales bacterium]MCF7864446.1 GPI inositol-deacylase [Kiritimatiellales bacterium]